MNQTEFARGCVSHDRAFFNIKRAHWVVRGLGSATKHFLKWSHTSSIKALFKCLRSATFRNQGFLLQATPLPGQSRQGARVRRGVPANSGKRHRADSRNDTQTEPVRSLDKSRSRRPPSLSLKASSHKSSGEKKESTRRKETDLSKADGTLQRLPTAVHQLK